MECAKSRGENSFICKITVTQTNRTTTKWTSHPIIVSVSWFSDTIESIRALLNSFSWIFVCTTHQRTHWIVTWYLIRYLSLHHRMPISRWTIHFHRFSIKNRINSNQKCQNILWVIVLLKIIHIHAFSVAFSDARIPSLAFVLFFFVSIYLLVRCFVFCCLVLFIFFPLFEIYIQFEMQHAYI